jgi:hypothetical protein
MKVTVWFGAFFFVASTALAAGEMDKVNSYKANGKIVMDKIIKKTIDPAEVKPLLHKMADDAGELATAYGAKKPDGAKLLKMVVDALPKLKTMSFEELEKDWHDLAYFSKPGNDAGIDLKKEKNEHFTDPIHCIVHPLMTAVAAESYAKTKKEEHLQAMKEELSEGLEQMDLLAKVFK